MKTFREFIGEGNATNWDRVNRRKKAAASRADSPYYYVPSDKKPVIFTDAQQKQAQANRKNRVHQGKSRKPITLPTLPSRKSED